MEIHPPITTAPNVMLIKKIIKNTRLQVSLLGKSHRSFSSCLFFIWMYVFTPTVMAQSGEVTLSGELRKWHPITLTLDGPASSETASPNPFLDYRFEVTFSNGATSYTIPGFFAADGDAANTSATAGSKWRVRFTPDQTGTWNYTISFREGSSVAVGNSPTAGSPNSFDGLTGSFDVIDTDKTGVDFRARGILRHVGEHYLRFDNGEWYIANGAGSPENMLGYSEIDNTFSAFIDYTHDFAPHVQDWQEGDPTWQDGKGKGLIGVVNYLSRVGVNAQFIIIMNTQGDAQETFPWIAHEDFYHFDVSKLAQWYIALEHMNKKGIVPHLVLQEMDNDFLLDNGELGTTRKMFYREMIARFGQLNGVQWNIGEEHDQFERGGNTTAQRLDFVTYLAQLDVYDHNIVQHTSAGQDNYNALYGPFLGNPDFGGMSFHIHAPLELGREEGGGPETHERALEWLDRSADNGHKWTLTLDECCGWWTGVRPDQSNIDDVRKYEMWGTLMAGGAGYHWYLGFGETFRDLTLEDMRTYEFLWNQSTYAADFFTTYVPFQEMAPMDELTPLPENHVLAKPGESYVVFLTDGGSTTLDLEGYGEIFTVDWYNPRTGGDLIEGEVSTLTGPGVQALGNPPFDTNEDWAVLVRIEPELELALSLVPDWNLVGLPIQAADPNYARVFDAVDFQSVPYVYSLNGYDAVTDLDVGIGYWLNTTAGGVQLFDGEAEESVTWTLREGWNMVSGPACALPITSATDPDDILEEETLYGYQGEYVAEQTLLPGEGYWIRTTAAGAVTLDCNAPSKTHLASASPNLESFGILEISDARGYSQRLYFGGNLDPVISNSRYVSPPFSPSGFDARFKEGTWLTQEVNSTIAITSRQYPVTVTLKRAPDSNSGSLHVQPVASGRPQEVEPLDIDVPVVFTDRSIRSLKLLAQQLDRRQLPQQFTLHGNYPNPFNPTTHIVFDLPEEAEVQVEVYDLLGRLVITSPIQPFNAGAGHQIAIDASAFASGTYIYHLSAQTVSGEWVRMGKMTVLK